MVHRVKTPIFAIAGQQEFIAFGTEKSPLTLMKLTDKKDEQIMEIQYPSRYVHKSISFVQMNML